MYPLLLLLFTLAFLLGSSDAAAAPSAGTISESTIYIIRHAEKTEDGLALSRLGLSRAECIADIFSNPALGINKLLVPRLGPDGSHGSSLNTTLPLARRLRLDVDSSCARNNVQCVGKKAYHWTRKGKGNVLIVWRHGRIANIAEYLGVLKGEVVCPEDGYDLIWTIRSGELISVVEEVCPNLEDSPEESGSYIDGGSSLMVQV